MQHSLILALALTLGFSAQAARAEDVALTFDDLPQLSYHGSTDYAEVTTRELLAGLKRHHLPAIGFVNESKLEGPDKPRRIALLTEWLDAGMDLGNHSYSHGSLTTMPAADYIADVARGETVTRALLAARGRTLHWYRHPYLETGPTAEIRQTFESWLAAHGYRTAPVTMENSDWMFALVYDNAVMHDDRAEAARVKASYLAYTAAIVPWYREAGLQLLGRRPAFVLLLHASRLNADSIDQLAAILTANDLHGVTLDQAMTDPAYTLAEHYAGPDGLEWLSRWSLELNKPLPWATLPPEPPGMEAEDARLDALP
jgi:peptidoglycan/xylan/chitin deacetylase (PgdA/CDA1 family)